ncbi:MAG: hypothetical protein ABIK37_03765 [candidate division WOR-3 bacterium]
MPANGVGRLTVAALVRPGMSDDDLRIAMDWVLHDVLERHNRIGHGAIRVVWVYMLEDSTQSISQWRAMAVWVDPRLPEPARPAASRIGGDAVRSGDVEYDFTNPVIVSGEPE